MSLTTLIQFVDVSSLQHLKSDIWRAVEAQHKVSTMRLVNNQLDDQILLEDMIEAAKPPVPDNVRNLHWLLFTPFRYRPRPPGSRFRAPQDLGVFYGAFERRTACAEAGYWKWRFVQDSEGLTKLDAHNMSLFVASIDTQAIDLRQPPYTKQRNVWMHPSDYTQTQGLARKAREVSAGAIIYESVRDMEHGGCVAVLSPEALARKTPKPESWFLTITNEGAVWQRELGGMFTFSFLGVDFLF